ncbi:hypothetical protein M408DRAFT_241552 [Serendipita vermifera MAFF 305830]|uniref:Peptidase A1 domain-containing protein n=1 Tax=Serendipita vermifera MAFF 305830 TaxID=933852 RepID=A0A0C3BIL7_SERVB|nr:hypothetical protein M408DRAFT_241552 [Serendipita vermifera MAFF 305830]
MVGLGRSGGDASFINNVFGQHQAWQNLTIGLALNGTEAGGQVGVMDLRATDSSYYTGDIKYIPVASASDHADVPANYPADWSLKLDSWTVNAGNVKTEFTANGVAIVEPYFPEIRFPIDQAELFYRDVSGATKLSDSSDGVTWSIPCKPSLSLEVNFNGSKFTVGADLLTTGDIANNNCTGVIRGWDNPFVESYMLGKAFAQTVYIVYNANRDGNGDTIGFAPRSGSGDELIGTKLNVATVVGISVGVTIAVILLLILAFLWWRHRRTVRVMESKPIKEGKGQHKIEPYSPTSGTQLYNMGNSQSNGPYVIEHGPIGGEIGPSTTLLSSMTPEASPSAATMSHSHRRKAEEAGYISSTAGTGSISSRGARESRRPPSSGTHASGSEFIQGLPPLPASPNTPEATGLHPGRFSTVPSSPGGAVGGPGVRPATMPAAPTPGTDSSHGRHVSQMLSPQSPQIHYHIHVTPEAAAAGGFLPSTIPPGSVIHEYPNDEPAPEYTERRQSHISDVSETDIPSPPLTASSQRPLQHHT